MSSPWPTIPAGRVARIEIGGTPARNERAFWAGGNDGHPWVSIADMREPVIQETNERITAAGVRRSNVKPVPAGTPLMSFKLTVGRVAVAGTDLFTNEAIAAFHVDESQVSPRWLVHVLPGAAARVVTDTAVKGATLNKAKLVEIPLELPPLREQRRIAEILDTLDEAIRRTEQVIAKLLQMKHGLLHDLLTRGIDDNGELRDPERHPEQFKDSPLGRIPRGWEVCRAGRLLTRIEQGWSPDCPGWPTNEGAWGVLRTTAVVWSGYQDAGNKALPSHLAPRPEYEVRPNDVLMTRAGPNSRVGVVALVDRTQGRLMLSDKLYRLVPATALIEPAFLVLALTGARTQRHLSTLKTGLAESQTNISQAIVRTLWLPVPARPEQGRICSALDAHAGRVVRESDQLDKLRTLKRGLMDDLLTGRVRVNVDSEATE